MKHTILSALLVGMLAGCADEAFQVPVVTLGAEASATDAFRELHGQLDWVETEGVFSGRAGFIPRLASPIAIRFTLSGLVDLNPYRNPVRVKGVSEVLVNRKRVTDSPTLLALAKALRQADDSSRSTMPKPPTVGI